MPKLCRCLFGHVMSHMRATAITVTSAEQDMKSSFGHEEHSVPACHLQHIDSDLRTWRWMNLIISEMELRCAVIYS
jgi:hypothetical protein